MIVKFDSYENRCKDFNLFLFHGSNLGKIDDCLLLFLKNKRENHQNLEIINLGSESLAKGEFHELFIRHNEPNIFGNPTVLTISLKNEKISKEIIQSIQKISLNTLYLVIKSEQLSTKSLLRSFFEKDSRTVIVPCYEETKREKMALISKFFHQEKIKISIDEVELISEMLANERLEIKNELEKIAILLKGSPETTRSIKNLKKFISDYGFHDETKFIFSIVSRKNKNFVSEYNRFTDFGNENVRLLSYLLEHLFRILFVKYKVKDGMTINEAVKRLRPPVFFKHLDDFYTQVSSWEMNELSLAIRKLYICKKKFVDGSLTANFFFMMTLLNFFKN
jgi:DNA polymerase-3 subunit delta